MSFSTATGYCTHDATVESAESHAASDYFWQALVLSLVDHELARLCRAHRDHFVRQRRSVDRQSW
jgi:hypothetical protein